jgi:hypothetical protein
MRKMVFHRLQKSMVSEKGSARWMSCFTDLVNILPLNGYREMDCPIWQKITNDMNERVKPHINVNHLGRGV